MLQPTAVSASGSIKFCVLHTCLLCLQRCDCISAVAAEQLQLIAVHYRTRSNSTRGSGRFDCSPKIARFQHLHAFHSCICASDDDVSSGNVHTYICPSHHLLPYHLHNMPIIRGCTIEPGLHGPQCLCICSLPLKTVFLVQALHVMHAMTR